MSNAAEIIGLGIVARLAAIIGDGGVTYNYTPDKVARVVALQDVLQDDSMETAYFYDPDKAPESQANTCRMGVELGFNIVGRRKYRGAGNVWVDGEARATIQNAMSADIRRALLDRAFVLILQAAGADVSVITPVLVDSSSASTYTEQWVFIDIPMVASYRYLAGAYGVQP